MNQNGKSYFQQGTHLRGGSAQAITTDPCALYEGTRGKLSIPSLALIGLAGMVHRKKGRHEEN